MELLTDSGQTVGVRDVIKKLKTYPGILKPDRIALVTRITRLIDNADRIRLTGSTADDKPILAVAFVSANRRNESLVVADFARLSRCEYNEKRGTWDAVTSTTEIGGRWLLPFGEGDIFCTIAKDRIVVAGPDLKPRFEIGRHELGVQSVDISRHGEFCVSLGRNGQVNVWNGATRRLERSFQTSAIYLALSPDGKRLLGSEQREGVRLWDVRSGERILQVDLGRALASSLSFTPDSKAFAVALSTGPIELRDAKTGKKRTTMIGHSGAAWPLVFSPDGRWMASCGPSDHTVRLWDLKKDTDHETARLAVAGIPTCVAFSRDGTKLAIGTRMGNSGHVRVLDVRRLEN
jgi:WD40 repeat protein